MTTLTMKSAIEISEHLHNSDSSPIEYCVHIYGGEGVVAVHAYDTLSNKWSQVGTHSVPVDDIVNRSENELNDIAANAQIKAFNNLLEVKRNGEN